MRAELPEVLTIQLPRDPADIPALLRRVWAFDRPTVTSADRHRTRQYQLKRERDTLRRQVASVEELGQLLDLRVSVRLAERSELSRISQLTYRTTQFNCTLRRRSEGELVSVWSRDDYDIVGVHAVDRLENYGLVGAVILQQREDEAHVDSWLLSCRALGCGIEQRMLHDFATRARDRGLGTAVIPFVPGARNLPARMFLDALPPVWQRRDLPDGSSEYRLHL
jgi:FkbH-like protein